VVKNGVRVAIVGRPNVGKSTLLNAFINEERAIVSNIPGTTRDSIEEVLNIKGILFRLIDTAGIRSHTVDVIEQMGMDRSRNHAQKADIILFLRDLTANEEPDFEWEKGLAVHWNKDGPFAWLENYAGKVIQVCTKFDQWQAKLDEEGISIIPDFTQNLVSAKTGFGIDALKDAIYEHVLGGKQVVQSNLVTNARHVEALENLQSGLEKVKDGLKQNISGDLLAPEIRSCLYYLGTITGQVEIDRDILGTIFGKFCIGK
jgi:tRNA modification GTPase